MHAVHVKAFSRKGGGKFADEQGVFVAGQYNAPCARLLPKIQAAGENTRPQRPPEFRIKLCILAVKKDGALHWQRRHILRKDALPMPGQTATPTGSKRIKLCNEIRMFAPENAGMLPHKAFQAVKIRSEPHE